MKCLGSRETITINVNNSTIAALNLNSIIQEVTATVSRLHADGNDQIATALKALTEAVTADDSLGPRRHDLLEAAKGFGEQAKLSAGNRKLGIVKSLFLTLRDVLAVGSSTATIWHECGPQIQQFFGF